MAQVCTIVKKRNSTRGKLPFLTVDYIQLACLGRHSVEIEVQDSGFLSSKVVIWKGEIWSAQQGPRKGHPALQALIFSVALQVNNLHEEDDPGPRDIPQNQWQKILLESSLCLDEQMSESSEKSPESVDDPGMTGMSFRELENLALDAMLDKRYAEAWSVLEYAHTLDPQNRRVEANLKRLRSLGFGGEE